MKTSPTGGLVSSSLRPGNAVRGRYRFDGQDWQCVRCKPSVLESPIRVELHDEGSPQSDSGCSRRPSVRRVSGCEITATLSGGHPTDLLLGDRVRPDGNDEA